MTATHISRPAITGVVLAGGQGRRLAGVDKGLLSVAGLPVMDLVLAGLRPQVDTVIISANRNLDVYARYGYPVIADQRLVFEGPLSGVIATMAHARTPLMLIVPCDGPELPQHLATKLAAGLVDSRADVAVAHDGNRLQPVHALLRTSLADRLHAYLAAGGRGVERWYRTLRMAQVDFSADRESFRNVNTNDDLQAANQWLQVRPATRETHH